MTYPRIAQNLSTLALAALVLFAGTTAQAGQCGADEPQRAEWTVNDAEGKPMYRAVFSGRTGTMVCFELLNEQFYIANPPELPAAQAEQIPAWLREPGPLNMVTTWRDDYLPFRTQFRDVASSSKVERTLVAPTEKSGFKAGERKSGTFLELYNADPMFKLVKADENQVVYVWPDPDTDSSTLFLERRFTRGENYSLHLSFSLFNFGSEATSVHPEVSSYVWPLKEGASAFFAPQPDVSEAMCQTSTDDLRRETHDGLSEPVDMSDATWIATGNRYFMKAVMPTSFKDVRCILMAYSNKVVEAKLYGANPVSIGPWDEANNCYPDWFKPSETLRRCSDLAKKAGLDSMAQLLDLGRSQEALSADARTVIDANSELFKNIANGKGIAVWSLDLFVGPKDIGLLENSTVGLEDSIDFWIVGFISKPMLWLLRWFHSLVPSWVVAIILLTLVVKIITYYPTMRSFVQMQRMASLKPLMDELKVKYEGDKQKQSAELMALYKREKVNPLGGCLPMLLQMPIWIALYRTIYASVDLFQAPMGLWITDMTQPDPYFVMPVVLGGLMFLQQKMTPTTMDNAQAKMMLYAMPIMFGVFSLFLPSALNLYILVNTILSIGQQWYLRRSFGTSVQRTASAKGR